MKGSRFQIPVGPICKNHHFRYWTHFGDLSNWYIPISTSVPTHGMLVHYSASKRKKKREKRKGRWRNIGGRMKEEGRRGNSGGRKKWWRRKKKEEEKRWEHT